MPTFHLPYVIYGYLYDLNSAIVANGIITAKNLSTGDIITSTTNSDGQFAIDCGNFQQGYEDGDTIKLFGASSSTISYELYFSVDGENNWMRTEPNVETTVSHNTVRRKIDKTNHPGGQVLDIKLIT